MSKPAPQTATAAAPTTQKPKAKTEAPTFKKGQMVQWTTGSRWGSQTHTGEVIAVIPQGAPATGKVAKAVAAQNKLDLAKISNRPRVLVKCESRVTFANLAAVKPA